MKHLEPCPESSKSDSGSHASTGNGRRPGSSRKKLIKLPIAIGLGLASILAPFTVAQPAQAASGDYSYVLNQTNVRICGTLRALWCGSSYNAVIGSVAGNQWDRTWCWKDGEWAGNTNRWFKITAWTNNGWRTGWVIASQVPRQASVPWCRTWQ